VYTTPVPGHRRAVAFLTDSDLMARIGEFQSFNFHAEGAFQIALTLGLAMLGAVAGLASEEGVEVHGMDAAAVSYPEFADDIARLAAR